VLLDMTDAGAGVRLAAARAAIPRAISLSVALSSGPAAAATPAKGGRRRTGSPATAAATAPPAVRPGDSPELDSDQDPAMDPDEALAGPARTPAVERRRGVEVLLGLWTDVARDLVLVASGGSRSVRDTVLLDELASIAAAIDPADAEGFLARAARSAEWLATNVSPELILDTLVLAWPRRSVAAA
jgi:hypothetical protein